MTFFDTLLELKKTNQIEGDIETAITKEGKNSIKIHSKDASAFEIVPQMVFFPKHINDIENILQVAKKFNEQKISISVRAGGSCMSGGSLNNGLIINLTRYMNNFEIDPVAKTAFVQMGTMFKSIATEAEKHGLLFGAYTSSKDICGIGGMIGNNASGEKSVRLGATIDNVLGLEVVLADGTIIRTGALENTGEPLKSLLAETMLKREMMKIHNEIVNELIQAIGNVSKCASGYRIEKLKKSAYLKEKLAILTYEKEITGKVLNLEQELTEDESIDLTPLFIGAQGTLGIVTQALIKLKSIPIHTRLLVISVNSLQELPFMLQTIMKYNPEGVETFDVHTFEKAKTLLSKETEICQQFFDKKTELVVLAQFSENSQDSTDAITKEAEQELKTHPVRVHWIDDVLTQESIWKIRRSSFGVMRDFNEKGMHAVPCIEDIIVPIAQFDKLIPGLQLLIEKYNISYGFHGHIGDGSLRIIPIFDYRKDSDLVANTIIDFTREAIDFVKSLGGNMSADHSDGVIRTPFLREFYGEKVFESFVRTKLLFDPQGILNRGKKIGGTDESIRKYLIKD